MVLSNVLPNAGIGYAASKSITSLWLILPFILIEGVFIARGLKQPFAKALAAAAIANIVSTLLGIVWVAAEFALMTLVPSLSSLMFNSVFILLVELLGAFLITVFSEFFVLHKVFKTCETSSVWRVTLLSNIVTYILLFIVAIRYMLYNEHLVDYSKVTL